VDIENKLGGKKFVAQAALDFNSSRMIRRSVSSNLGAFL
jgi:hypothetical protein